MSTTVKYRITSGPSANQMIDTLKYTYKEGIPREVRTVSLVIEPYDERLRGVVGSRKIDATVNGIRYESGLPGMFIVWLGIDLPHHEQVDEHFYNANLREGTLKFEVDSDWLAEFLVT